ncbi:MAG: ECF-type sigma factor [Pirellulaceae bacterium]
MAASSAHGDGSLYSKSSITQRFERLKQGDCFAAQVLWGHDFRGLVQIAGAKCRGTPRRVADEEDAALTVLH